MKALFLNLAFCLVSTNAFALSQGAYDCTPSKSSRPVTLQIVDSNGSQILFNDERTSAASNGTLLGASSEDRLGQVVSFIYQLTDFHSDNEIFSALTIAISPDDAEGQLRVRVGAALKGSTSLSQDHDSEFLTCVLKP